MKMMLIFVQNDVIVQFFRAKESSKVTQLHNTVVKFKTEVETVC